MAGINRTQIEDEVARALGGNKDEAKIAVAAVVYAVQRTLVEGERVHITGIGSINAKPIASRWVRNPATGKRVKAKKTARVTIRPGEDLKDFISGRKKLKAPKDPKTGKPAARAVAKVAGKPTAAKTPAKN